jgi:hypothetical protein
VRTRLNNLRLATGMLFTCTVLTVFGGSLLTVAAAGVDPPSIRPGQWEFRIQHSVDGKTDVQPGKYERCQDANALAQARVKAAEYAKTHCSKNDTRQEGGKWVNDLVCKTGASTSTSHTVTDYTGDTTYHTEMTTTSDPPDGRSVAIIDGKWLRACQP